MVQGHAPRNGQLALPGTDHPPRRPPGRRKRDPAPVVYSEDFAAFWEQYPWKTEKAAAFAEWPSAVSQAMLDHGMDHEAAAELIATQAHEYRLKTAGRPKYRLKPTNWLRRRCWDDGEQCVGPDLDAMDELDDRTHATTTKG